MIFYEKKSSLNSPSVLLEGYEAKLELYFHTNMWLIDSLIEKEHYFLGQNYFFLKW